MHRGLPGINTTLVLLDDVHLTIILVLALDQTGSSISITIRSSPRFTASCGQLSCGSPHHVVNKRT
jgi:hypothetical protein